MASSETAIKKLAKCVKKRERLFSKLQLCFDLTKELEDENKQKVFIARCSELSSLYSDFEDLAEEMDELNVTVDKKSDEVDTSNPCKQFDIMFYQIKAAFDSLSTNKNLVPSNIETSSVQPKLPQIDIPKFGGQLEQFSSFKSLFDNLINSSTIAPIEKFSYLKSLLEGPALSVIEAIPFDPEHYDLAYTTLVERYTNPRILASFYLNKILEHPPLKYPNLGAFRQIIDTFNINVEALKSLKVDDLLGFVFLQIALRLLDTNSRKQFEQEYKNVTFPQLKHLIDFLRTQCAILELTKDSTKPSTSMKPSSNPTRKSLMTTHPTVPKNDKTKLYHTTSNKKYVIVCPLCKNDHHLYHCSQFLEMNTPKRYSTIRSLKRCFSCLGSHLVPDCFSTYSCRHCHSKRHHSLLHQDSADKTSAASLVSRPLESTDDSPATDSPATTNQSAHSLSCSSKHPDDNSSAILSTAKVLIQDSLGHWQPCRVIIDGGSQVNFITSELAQSLGLPQRKCSINISGIGQSTQLSAKRLISCRLASRFKEEHSLQLDAVMIPRISSDLPASSLPDHLKKQFSSLSLADPDFNRPAKIDMLLGAQAFSEILTDGVSIIRGKPTALHTIFGWVLMGEVMSENPLSQANSFFISSLDSTDQLLSKFWEMEEINSPKCLDPDDLACEIHYQSTISRDETGRYIASLPFKDGNPPNLGSNREIAQRKFHQLENRFQRNPDLKTQYIENIDDYVKNQHLLVAKTPSSYLLTHHGVHKESTSSPLRVVFNASEQSDTKNSLNKSLLTGPKLQANIENIITNFRTSPIALTCDIKQMYRAIRLSPADCQYQHILWRKEPSDPLLEYELQRLTFGVSSSPFIAQRTLKQLVQDEGPMYPVAAEVLSTSCYIDDIVCGAKSENDAISLYRDLTDMLSSGGFELHRWSSSSSNVLNIIPQNHRESPHPLGSDNTIKVLGLEWDPNSDCFRYSIKPVDQTPTKRNILSQIARIYDVNGYISPVVFTLKHLMQQLWLEKLDWDDTLSSELQVRWNKIISEIPLLIDLKIPRYILGNYSHLQLVGFTDASKIGMCAAIYLRAVSENGNVSCHLLQSKTKVTPLKQLSIPRLELCAALLLSKLINSNQDFISKLNIEKPIIFTDSMNVISWLNTPPHLLETFVSNRVSKILEHTTIDQWHHVPGNQNPADCGSRGLLTSQIISNTLWWHGPPFLKEDNSSWPKSNLILHLDVENSKTNFSSLPARIDPQNYLHEQMCKYSTFTKLTNVFAYVLRFIHNSRHSGSQRKSGCLSVEERNQSIHTCIRITQNVYYTEDIRLLKNNKPCSNSLKHLTPFLSHDTLMVGGRLRHAPLSDTAKHPYLIPSKSHLASLICDHFHVNTLHGGPKLIQSLVQRKYWIPGIRNLLKHRLFKCLRCYKMKAKPIQPLMADLPRSRFQQGRCFENVGLDFAGPYLVKEHPRRNARLTKCYIAIFVCMSVKAIHLELVGSLTTESCIAAMDRFISRRGLPRNIYSDQGTNFVGAARHLKEVYELLQAANPEIQDHLAKQEIIWNFNPPHAANFGGLWEAGVKSTKHHLKRILEDHHFTTEEFSTFLCRIESILNSRPLCPVSTYPEDGFDYLTPGHFLIGAPLISRPEESLDQEPMNHLTRWKKISHATQLFWKRWSKEYIHTLIHRPKWSTPKANLKIGDLVFLFNANIFPLSWPMGRVVKVFPGLDGTVRVVQVKTSSGMFTRPVNKLVPLPY